VITRLIEINQFPIWNVLLFILSLPIALWFMKRIFLNYWRYWKTEFPQFHHQGTGTPTSVFAYPVTIATPEPPGEVEIRLDLTRKRERG